MATAPNPIAAATARWPWPAWLQASVGAHVAALGVASLVPGAAPWALAGVVANHALLTAAGLWPRSTLLGPNVRQLPADAAARGEWALTLDDGPDPATTPAVLDLLDAHGVKATFFCIAERARAHPALLRRIVAGGHDVQNHSHRHRHDFSLLGPGALQRDIQQAQHALSDLTGRRPHCFRAPAGLRSPLLDPVLHRLDLHLVSWTRRGFDTRGGPPPAVLARLTANLGGGDILLLHDGRSRSTAAGRPAVLDVLPPLLATCSAAGLRAVTLQHALPRRHAAAAST